jgi:membrane protein involved in colicin uptake
MEKVPAEPAPRLTPQSSGPDTSQEPTAANAPAPDERRARAEAELARKLAEKEAKKQPRAAAEAARKAEEQRLAAEKASTKAEAEKAQKQTHPEWDLFNQVTPISSEQKKALESGAAPPP